MYKVSIIIPVYNAEKYLERCIDSLINQTYKNIEIIAINDGSKDNSLNILKKYQRENKNIKVHTQENIGISKTRNKGIKHATGDYIMFVDNDDFLDSDYIETYIEELKEREYDVIIGGYRRVNTKNKIIKEIRLKNKKWCAYMIVAPWAKLYKREYVKKKNLEFLNSNIGEDIYFTLPAVSLTENIKIISYIGYNWFYNDKSVSNTIHKEIKKDLQFEFLLNNLYKKVQEENLLKDSLIEYYFIKTIIWFLFYTCQKTNINELLEAKKYYFQWLEKNFKNYQKNKNIKLYKPQGEKFINKVLVYSFIKLNLSIPLLKLYKRIGK